MRAGVSECLFFIFFASAWWSFCAATPSSFYSSTALSLLAFSFFVILCIRLLVGAFDGLLHGCYTITRATPCPLRVP